MAGKSAFARHYDKFVAALCVALLCAALYLWLSAKGGAVAARGDYARRLDALSPDNPAMDDAKAAAEAMAFSNAFVRISRPYRMALDPARKTGFFVPEKRVWCVQNSCQAPIPPDAEACPRCGAKQPTKKSIAADASIDSDGDGMPDVWERAHNLNPLDPADAALDSDGDGFTNLEEFLAKTNPLDKGSHTDLMTLLRVESIAATKLPVKFMNTILLPDRTYKCQFNYYDRETRQMTTLMVKEGERLGPLPPLPGAPISAPKRHADFRLAKIDWREETVVDKFSKREKVSQVPVAIVERVSTGRSIEFRKEVEATDTDYKITLIQTHGGERYEAEGSEGEAEFSMGGRSFRIKKVDKSAQSVVIVSLENRKEYSIPSVSDDAPGVPVRDE